MSDHEEIEPLETAVRKCGQCGVLAFEPQSCAKCDADSRAVRGALHVHTTRATDQLCTDCRTECEVCRESFCEEHLEHHGCKRNADPADVMLLEGYYANDWAHKLDAVYSINGHTYFVVTPSGGWPAPPDAIVYR